MSSNFDEIATTAGPLVLRPSTEADLPAITAIYAWNVLHGTGTFELEAPSLAEMSQRWRDIQAKGLPWLVAERGSERLGYAYANPFRPRLAYRFCLEDSIYLHPSATRQGVGRTLLNALIEQCTVLGGRQMLAVIGDSENHASIALHRACGFEPIGQMEKVGWKFERWLDVVLMQRRLGDGEHSAPQDAPASLKP